MLIYPCFSASYNTIKLIIMYNNKFLKQQKIPALKTKWNKIVQ